MAGGAALEIRHPLPRPAKPPPPLLCRCAEALVGGASVLVRTRIEGGGYRTILVRQPSLPSRSRGPSLDRQNATRARPHVCQHTHTGRGGCARGAALLPVQIGWKAESQRAEMRIRSSGLRLGGAGLSYHCWAHLGRRWTQAATTSRPCILLT